MKINKLDLIILLPFIILLVITDKYNLIYLPIAFIVLKDLWFLKNKKIDIEEILFSLIIYSYIIPNNFAIIWLVGVLLVFYAVKLRRNHGKVTVSKKFKYINIAAILYLVINIIVNKVPINNIALYFMYNFVFVAMAYIFILFKPKNTEVMVKYINTAIVSQMVCVTLVAIFKFNVVLSNLFGDWSVGTIGISGGVHLFNLFVFGAIIYLDKYMKERRKLDIVVFALCVIYGLSTVTVANTILFFGALVLYAVFFVSSRRIKILFLASAIVLGGVFWFTAHPWVKDQLTNMVIDSEFRNKRIKKLKVYEDTFVSLPKKDAVAGIVGAGAGNYSSRAALTASGYYTGWYNSERFKVYTSNYARKYVRPRVYKRMGLSIIEVPTSQYIQILGEYGYIGFLFFIAMILYMFRKSVPSNKLLLIYVLFTLSLDNYFEYPKIAMLMIVAYYIIQNKEKVDEGILP